MVFESLVADLLNRFLGDFVDNLDASQLNIGIWGGDVKLDNLEVKETALDDLDLPIKLKFGYLSSLVLKIPWKNLYNESVIATIDGLYLIVVPNKGVVYNEEKAMKNAADIKQKTLVRLEEARKNRRKPPDSNQDSFTEKMITQVVKNLQVSIGNIHIRFEDKYTNRNRPFAAGICLEKLDFQTTDENWVPTIHRDAVKIFHKLVLLDSLSIYWNSDASLFSDTENKLEIRKKLKESISRQETTFSGYKYVLKPIKMEAKLKLNQKPETDGTNWSIPKIDLNIDMETLELAINKYQYQDILLFLEAQERFNIATQFLKYRPNLNVFKGHYREWWRFAYNAILEEKVRRRRNNWSWSMMSAHRKLVRDYRDAWLKYLVERNPNASVTDVIKKAEQKLDVFNLNIARQQAEMEIDRKGLKRVEDQPQGWLSWGTSWFSSGRENMDSSTAKKKDFASQFNEVMTAEEKEKLFEAIDYQENIPPTNYPKEFIENRLDFCLRKVAVIVDGAVALNFLGLRAHVEQRPSASAINIKSTIQELKMDGDGTEMVRVRDSSKDWLKLTVDTHPIHGNYDQFIQLAIAPINFKYHAPAVNNALDVFRPPESVKLNQLAVAAMSRYEEVKARSVTGLAHAVENRSRLVLDIQIQPATIFICEGGVYDIEKPTILADLGHLSVTTIEGHPKVDEIKDKLHQLMDKAYDKFQVKLSNVVVSLAENVSKGCAALGDKNSPLHILKPTGLDIQIHKCSIDDLRLPRIRVIGTLPDIVISISDIQILDLTRLLLSIPTPKADADTLANRDVLHKTDISEIAARAKIKSIMEVQEIETNEKQPSDTSKTESEKSKLSEQQVQLELDLHLNKIGFIVVRKEDILCKISFVRMGCKLQLRTFDMVVAAELGAIRVGMPTFKPLIAEREYLYFIDSNAKEGSLMTFKLIKADPESPFFGTDYRYTEQAVDFHFRSLNISLHQEGLMELKQFAENMQRELNNLQKNLGQQVEETVTVSVRRSSVSTASPTGIQHQTQTTTMKKKHARKSTLTGVEEHQRHRVIKMHVESTIGSLTVAIGTQSSLDSLIAIENIRVDMKTTAEVMNVVATLKTVKMEDMTEGAFYRKLLSVTGEKEMLRVEFTQFQRTEQQKKQMLPSDIDMSVKVRMAEMRFVFLNLFLCRTMAWVAPFQAEAARAAAAAQAAASEKAVEAAQNVKQLMVESPPRVQLDVELEAPVILLPQLSTSRNVLVFILGKLVISNYITTNKQYQNVIMDHMDIRLLDMKFGIGSVNDDASNVQAVCDILEPLSFNIAIHRNLVYAVVKELPELTIDAQIPSLSVNLSDHDYDTLMQTLSGNLAEGNDVAVVPPVVYTGDVDTVESAKESSESTDYRKVGKDKLVHSSEKGIQAMSSTVGSSKPRMVFQFSLENISAVLHTGESNSKSWTTLNAFAAMKLYEFKISGSIKEDNSMDVAMSLKTFTMSDERRDKTKIHQLLDKKDINSTDRFLTLAFLQDCNQNKNIKLKMSAFFICLCPEFLGSLLRFFTVTKTPEQIDREMDSLGSSGVIQKSGSSQSSATNSKSGVGNTVLDCDMQGVEVILVENSMQPDTTQALILSFNIKMTTLPSPTGQVMNGGVEKLVIFSSYYAQTRRHEVTYQVLKSMNIGIEMRVDTPTKATTLLLKMSPMEIRMSPSIIRLLSAVNAEFAKSSAMSLADSSTVEIKPRSFPDYWRRRRINQKKFWFFHATMAEDASELEELVEKPQDPNESDQILPEHASLIVDQINFTLESGEGAIPVPLIFMQMLLKAEASDWSSALKASADLSLQMSYYNEAISIWEPVIEPIEDAADQWTPWNLRMTIRGRSKLDALDVRPAMDIKIETDDILNLTVTKTFISLLNNVSEKFAHAAKQFTPPTTRQLPGLCPFLVLNETGIIMKIAASEDFQLGDSEDEVEAEHGRFIDLHMSKEAAAIAADSQKKERLNSTQVELSADLRISLLDTVRQVKIGRAGKVAIGLPKKSDGGYQWKIIAETTIENGRRLVTFTSHVHVSNHLDVSMELYSKNDTNLDLFGTVAPGETLQLAVPLLFSSTGEIFFRPANDKCEVSFESISWHQFTHMQRQTVRCDFSEDVTLGYFFEAVILEEKVCEGIDKYTEMFFVHLYPPLQFHNILPFPITVEIPVAMDIEPGGSVQLNIVTNHRLRLWVPYLGEMYSLDMTIPQDKKDLEVVALNTDSGSSELLLGIHWSTQYGDLKAYLYAPFWLVNNTSMILKHMESGRNFMNNRMRCIPCRKNFPAHQDTDFALEHLPNENPLILPFPSTDFTRKKKSRVLVENAVGWSEEFPLDTVGNPARIVCKGKDRDYELTVNIKLCQSGLTKIVSFCPFYLVSNLGKWDMQVKEYGLETWIDVPAEKCIGIWPQQRTKRKLLCVKYADQCEESLFFPITENFESLCQINNDRVGVEACVSTSDSSVAIHLTPFSNGMAPVCIMNNLNIPVAFGQKGHQTATANTNEMMYFTWPSVVEERVLTYTVGDCTGEDKLDQNRIADFQINRSARKFAYLANFLIGRQRFLLFTHDLDIARAAYGSWETDNVNIQIESALQGVGLSIVDNSIGKELLYIGISSSDILWEEEVRKGRFKPFAVKFMQMLEENYQEYLAEPRSDFKQIEQYEVSFENMIMKKKKGKEVKIRRIFEKGIWANYGTSSERTRLHLKINHLQIDNQLGTCVFPRVLTNIPPPKSVLADNAPKPFIELSLLQRKSEYSSVLEIEYARVLVQEFAIQIDQGLINALMALVDSEIKKEPYGKQLFLSDMDTALLRLEDTAKQYKSNQPRSFYNDLHISPLMIHLSFSQGGTVGEGENSTSAVAIQSEFFKVLFQSIGVSVTELQDVVFKLAYFERSCVFYRYDQLQAEIVSHYTMQALRQMYVLVLGLDIIGNPFGLVRDLSAGVEDLFYQPFQGLIQGPEEFATGVALGVQSMFGHAVGGAAGAVGRITGTVGKGVAALTFDQEYQRKRQEDLNRRPQSFSEGIARGVKGLGTGLVGGITGIVMKPIQGAKEEGGVGFVKGIGKGLIGAVTRPVSGVVDFASSTMHSVRTVAGADKEARALRPPRVILADRIVRPFSFHEAIGFKIFNDVDRGELADTDNFVTFAQITDKVVLLVTNMQLVLAKRTDLVGTWATEWKTEYLNIKEPVILEDGIKVLFKEKKRGFMGFGSSEGKIITFNNAKSVQQKMLAAYRAATQLPNYM